MAIKNEALFNAIHIDIQSMMDRFMNNEELYLRFLRKLPTNTQIDELREQIAAGNQKDALMTSHNLKSFTGNLSLTKLHQLFTTQVKQMRENDWDGAVAIMPDINEEYNRIVAVLKEYGIE